MLKPYHFQRDGISLGNTIYNLTLKHYKKLLQTTTFVQQEQYFLQAEKKDFYFDCLSVRPFMIYSFIFPEDYFSKHETRIISFCKNILDYYDGYYGFVIDIETLQNSTILTYSEQQHLKLFSPAVSHTNIMNEIQTAFFSTVERYDYLFFNHCILPHFNDTYINPIFYKKLSFGQNFIQIKAI